MPQVLVISTARWPIPARISLSLAKAGFAVAAISPAGSFVRQTSAVQRQYSYRIAARRQSLIHAIADWRPDLLVCTDDLAVGDLHALHDDAVHGRCGDLSTRLAKLIETSLGAPSSFEIVTKKSLFIPFAQSKCVRCPRTIEISLDNIDEVLGSIDYPVLVKTDGAWGGKYVRMAENASQARRTFCEFELPSNWPGIVRSHFAKVLPLSFFRLFSWRLRRTCLQEFIFGSAANRAVVCWNGKILAGISVKVVATTYAFGPASVIEVIDHPEMTAVADVLVNELKLSGFIGFDFVLDRSDQAYLIEMNPRVTPTAYLGGPQGVNLSAALFARITNTEWTAPPNKLSTRPLSLFPQELQRSPRSDAILSDYDDVPWEDPKLVFELLKSVFKAGLVKRLGAKRRNQQQFIIDRAKRAAVTKSEEAN
jgi:glutathione synthase/RimK-type ligase-like ATP-grasp enzyme